MHILGANYCAKYKNEPSLQDKNTSQQAWGHSPPSQCDEVPRRREEGVRGVFGHKTLICPSYSVQGSTFQVGVLFFLIYLF